MSKVKLDKIYIDGGTQPRVEIDEDLVAEYADEMRDGDTFPPVILFNDGAKYWLADGFHRYHASKKVGYLEIEADVKNGTKRDAVLYSVSANGKHGKRRTNPDKRKAVKTLLEDEEWSQWSDREIARKCEVSNPFVSKLRKSLLTVNSENDSRIYTDKHGNESKMNTSNIGNRSEKSNHSTNGHKTYFKENKPKKNTPRMGDFNSTEEDRCPMCGQTWPEHQQSIN